MASEGGTDGDAGGVALEDQEEGWWVDVTPMENVARVGGEAGSKHLKLCSSWYAIIGRLNRHEDWLQNLEDYREEQVAKKLRLV